MTKLVAVDVHDVRFPTSAGWHGSDAMNPDPDYSAAYVVLRTDEGPHGHGFVFTIGRGNEVQCAAIQALAPVLIGRDVEEICGDLGVVYRELVGDSQFRWLGPEKGIMHMAIGAIVNAVWDLAAKRAGKPVWKLLADLTPEELVALVDWRYLSDALTPAEALDLLKKAEPGRAERERRLRSDGIPAYTTTPGWLGYDDATAEHLARQAVADGFRQIKLKVGRDLDDDRRRLAIARRAVGDDIRIAVDANQCWDVAEAVSWVDALREFDLWWVEEPTSPDDILGHKSIREGIAPTKVATGEHVQNRVIVKQLLQAGAVDILQLDATRVGGVNENLAILLLAAKFGVPVCPHAGGVGLCELVQHLAAFDAVAVGGDRADRVVEFADHLHEHFLTPAVVRRGAYVVPTAPGFSAEMRPEALARYGFPDGPEWSGAGG
ncbi:enolase C-terminal domain-like protein [Actinopolymorpha sp. B11F2]|uniref:enolase C-terminal domain-like protein n=1 Tax=Actinopolymorpha sp. B11F2 TaxID=3160862 RepID=UPI0032E3E76F